MVMSLGVVGVNSNEHLREPNNVQIDFISIVPDCEEWVNVKNHMFLRDENGLSLPRKRTVRALRGVPE